MSSRALSSAFEGYLPMNSQASVAQQRGLFERLAAKLSPDTHSRIDFTKPAGEPALTSPDSVSWRVFKNPISLFIGGVTAVLMEFAEPKIRSGVWDHSTFKTDPL